MILTDTMNASELWDLAQRVHKTPFAPTYMAKGELNQKRTIAYSPETIYAMMLYGQEVGISPMQSISAIQIISNRPALSPESMRALIFLHGHSIVIDASPEKAVAVCKRKSGESGTFTFTYKDAEKAGLTSQENWRKYTPDMLSARVTARAARSMFPDVIKGLSYIPEEVESFSAPSEEPPKRNTQKVSEAFSAVVETPTVVQQTETQTVEAEPVIEEAPTAPAETITKAQADEIRAVLASMTMTGRKHALGELKSRFHVAKADAILASDYVAVLEWLTALPKGTPADPTITGYLRSRWESIYSEDDQVACLEQVKKATGRLIEDAYIDDLEVIEEILSHYVD